MKRSYIREILEATNDETISFAGGLPNKELFPLDELKSASIEVFKNNDCLQYSKSQGLDSLREKIANIYTHKLGMKTTKEEILITTGSQQAFDIIIKSLNSKEIIVEKPTYVGALSSFRVLNMKINGFNKIKDLNQILNKSNILYLISDYQNPSTNLYNKEERNKFVKVLKDKESILIEDGAYNFLNFDNKVMHPISKDYAHSFHLGSFSKIVAPGLRVGWIRSTVNNIDNLLAYKESLDLHTSTFNQMLLNEYLTSCDLFEHISNINKINKEKMNFMAKCFIKYIPSFKFEKPEGGMFIYGSFNMDSMILSKEVIKENIAFVPGIVFYLEGKSKEARFNFTNESNDNIEIGLKKIAEIIDSMKPNTSIWLTLFNRYKTHN